MIDITRTKAMAIADAKFGHLLLWWLNDAPYYGIRVNADGGGFLAFHAPIPNAADSAAAPATLHPNASATVCLDLGAAAVCWPDRQVAKGRVTSSGGDLVIDEGGVWVVAAIDQHNVMKSAWRLADGERRSDVPPPLLTISTWEIGVRDEDRKFCSFEQIPSNRAQSERLAPIAPPPREPS